MKNYLICLLSVWLLTACSHTVNNPEKMEKWPEIYPDYIGVTIPATIAPMNFNYIGGKHERIDVTVKGSRTGEIHINAPTVSFPEKEWHNLLTANKGDSLLFTVCIKSEGRWKQYLPFTMYVSDVPIDYGVVYRKIAPGYEVYAQMGIYERDLSSFEERDLLQNTIVPGMCLNCHAFNRTNPNQLSLHIRGQHGATLMQTEGHRELLDTKTDSTLSACVYPYWHPGGKYIAYSVNQTTQSFHVANAGRIEVMDMASDVLVYRPDTHELLQSPLLQKKEAFETFPAFSPDGRKLYFCSATSKPMPEKYDEIRYSLCCIDFNPDNGTFGERVDTLIHAERLKKSISFPRPSYDGKYIMFTLSDYGNFSIWHKEADLWLLNLQEGSMRAIDEVNSDNTESYHSWSSNSRWFVFSSRRDDGLYTRLYLAYIGADGHVSKPFMLPQKNPQEYYDRLIYSYNVPEFTNQPIQLEHRRIENEIVSGRRVKVKVRSCPKQPN